MLDQMLNDMSETFQNLRNAMEDYGKAVGSILNNPNWEADANKTRSKVKLVIVVAKAQIKALEKELEKLGGSEAGRKEIQEKLLQIWSTQERLKAAVVKAEEAISEKLIQST